VNISLAKSGRIVTDRRSRLKPVNVANLVLLKGSWAMIDGQINRKRKLEV
jgi:hypothetical protein